MVRPVKPSSAGSCEMAISTAAPCVKPISTGELTSRSSQPKRPAPSTIWIVPDISVSHTAIATHSALPATASGASEAPTSKLVSAVGPTDSRWDELNITAISAGNSAAYTPVTSGMPASAAYATPCGMTISATVMPAIASLRSSAAEGRGQARQGTQRERRWRREGEVVAGFMNDG